MTNKEAANELKNYHREDGTVPEEIILAIKVLEERPQGEWVGRTNFDGFTYWKCSECNKEYDFINFKYCPNCGAYMRKEG